MHKLKSICYILLHTGSWPNITDPITVPTNRTSLDLIGVPPSEAGLWATWIEAPTFTVK